MGTATPLLDRIAARRKAKVGPLSPVPLDERRSEFSRRLIEKRLVPKSLLHDVDADGTPAA